MAEIALSTERLCKHFGDVEVLRDISVDIPAGTTNCILGPSGSGKSTFLRCLNWLEEPTSGAITVAGVRLQQRSGKPAPRRELALARGKMAMVFQNFALWPHLTVLENIVESPVHVLHRPRDEVRAEGLALLERVGLAAKADVYPHTLSGGQKQRVAICRALAMRPQIVLFDEPTSALDPEMVGEVLAVMRELAAGGLTMLIVTHEMAFARDVADTVIFMDQGQVREISPPSVFFTNPGTERAQRFLQRFMG
ncbi:amino acid ABC transporter ATP-binding protein [Thauera sinica]|uniref:Amino acid ABC transporter ATP-binding protein n=1 Tax=Thauera sinica TaxID=2665146 RepID=A0ABW1AKR5_9RHOO|nr:amino acid ABC transporter ATP-binding protein [Thauera sp. K11]ATE59834.1 glutamate ABC transporter ATP-binding protein [Thauera sp. K11]